MANNNAPLVGQQIGNYQIIAPVASGAFGAVYQAKHQYLQDRVVAIKVLHMHLSTAEEQQKFVREAQLLEKLQHHYILSILDVGIFNNLPYLITPYAVGGSLRQRMKRTGQIPPWDITLRLVTQIGQALHYAHQQQVVHRDLKPENILLSEKNEALLGYQQALKRREFKLVPPLAAALVLYRELLGSDISVVIWNLAAYEGSPVPSGMDRVLLLSGFDANSLRIIEQWLRAGSPGSAMPTAQQSAPAGGGESGSSFEAILAALRRY